MKDLTPPAVTTTPKPRGRPFPSTLAPENQLTVLPFVGVGRALITASLRGADMPPFLVLYPADVVLTAFCVNVCVSTGRRYFVSAQRRSVSAFFRISPCDNSKNRLTVSKPPSG